MEAEPQPGKAQQGGAEKTTWSPPMETHRFQKQQVGEQLARRQAPPPTLIGRGELIARGVDKPGAFCKTFARFTFVRVGGACH